MTRFGLSRSRRLRRRPQFDNVLNKNCSNRDRLFVVYAAHNMRTSPRLGLVVSRRVSTKAVVRNRLKRRVRETFRRNQASLNGLDVVVIARPPAAPATGPELIMSLTQHWKRIRQQCKNF